MLPELEQNSAKIIAMSARSFVRELSDSLVTFEESTPDLTGWLVTAMPGIFERAILSSRHLPSDQALSVCEKFFSAYKEITRVTGNAAGFSNSIQKLLFNATFSRTYERESSVALASIRKLWDESRETRADHLEDLSLALVAVAELKTGLQLASDQRVSSVQEVLAKKFADVHAICR